MIPGGNDSFGTGISAGGAQVMGQSAGLNDLVKLGMARQRQRQVRPWNAPLQNIDTSKIKGVDAQNIANFVNKGKDEYISGNMATDPTERYMHQMASDNYMAQASELSRQSQDNNEKLKNFRTLAQGENVDPTLVDGINKKLRRFELAQSGTKESDDAEADMGDFRKYQKVDMSKLDMDARSLYEKQKIDSPSNMLGFQDVHSDERMHVNTTAMYHHYADYGRYNTAADNQFKQMGQEAMADTNNKTLIANLATRYPIDPTNPAQVGYAIKANDQYNTAKGYHIEGDHIIKPTRPTIFNIGGQQTEQDSQGLNGIITPGGVGNINASQKAIADNGGELPTVKTQYRMNYDRIFGNGGKKITVAGGPVFTVADGKTIDAHPGTEFKMVGTSYKYKFNPGTVINGHKMDGGYANAKTEQYIEDHPTSAMAKNFTKVNITHGYMTSPGEDGNGPQEKEVFYPSANLPRNALFGKTSGKSIEANSNANNNTYLKNLTIKNNQANPTNEANIKESFNGKTLPGYKKSK